LDGADHNLRRRVRNDCSETVDTNLHLCDSPLLLHCLLMLVGWRNAAADLLHKRQKIADPPMVSDFAVLDSHNIDRLEVDPATRRSNTKKSSFMRAVICFVCRYPITVRKLPVDLSTKVRECGAKKCIEPSHTRFVWSGVRLGSVIDEVIRE